MRSWSFSPPKRLTGGSCTVAKERLKGLEAGNNVYADEQGLGLRGSEEGGLPAFVALLSIRGGTRE